MYLKRLLKDKLVTLPALSEVEGSGAEWWLKEHKYAIIFM